MKIKIITLLLLLFVTSCNNKPSTPNEVKFNTYNNIPVVQGTINGKKANFIIDSGASLTIVNNEFKDKYGFGESKLDLTIEGINGGSTQVLSGAYNCEIKLNDIKINTVIVSQNISSLSRVFRTNNGIEINGIIGSDVFTTELVKIDYDTKTVIFY